MTKILVTGGLGYIGSHTVVELINNGFEVVIVDNLSNSRIEILDQIYKITGKNVKFYELDVCNEKALNIIFEENKINSIIHFAAYKSVNESMQKVVKYYENTLSIPIYFGLTNLDQKYIVSLITLLLNKFKWEI